MRKIVAVLLCLSMCALLAGCFGGDEPTTLPLDDEESTTAPSSLSTDDDTSEPEGTTDGDEANTVTVRLVTEPGATIPTVVTSQWNTTLPSGVAPSATITETTTSFTIPGESVTRPVVLSTVMPSTATTATTDTNSEDTPGSSGTTGTTNGAGTTQTTEKINPKALELLYSMHSQSGDGIVVEFESTGWKGSIKSASARVNVVVNGSQEYSSVKCTVLKGFNPDERIEVTLHTSGLDLQTGDSVVFSLPEGMVRTADGAFYNSAYSHSLVL